MKIFPSRVDGVHSLAMHLRHVGRSSLTQVIGLSLLAFLVVVARFSPNWIAFYRGVREAAVHASNPAQREAVEKAIFSGYAERGLHVLRQARDLGADIPVVAHKIVRWRLLIPAIGHYLDLPDWLVLGLAHIGCFVVILALVIIIRTHSTRCTQRPHELFCTAITIATTAPIFTSMGWLGYYDSWLVLALLGVAFVRWRPVVALACLVGPWIDERFVVGLPLALLIRKATFEPDTPWTWLWARREALLPVLLTCAYAALRLQLGGSRGSQTVDEYLKQFVFSQHISAGQRLWGALAGLRFGLAFVLAAVFYAHWHPARRDRWEALLLAVAILMTATIGLVTALDVSRSMALLWPVLPLGAIYASRTEWWSRFHVAPSLAAAAILLPAYHVCNHESIPVDNFWQPSLPLLTAQNNLGLMYREGDGVPKDGAAAFTWFRRAAQNGSVEAVNNLGVAYFRGEGVSQNYAEAAEWFRRAAEYGNDTAQYNLALMYVKGTGIAKDYGQALRWYLQAAWHGNAVAQQHLAVIYENGVGVEKDQVRAAAWLLVSSANGVAAAKNDLARMRDTLDAAQRAQAEKFAQEIMANSRSR
jgi:hypothetical protein